MASPVGVRGASVHDDAPIAFEATPVPAVKPSYPRDPKLVIEPDPDFPALQRDLPTRATRVGQYPFLLGLQVPRGWVRNVSQYGEWRFYPPPGPSTPSNPTTYNTYFMRIRLVGNLNQTITRALTDRIDALRGATGVKDFAVESLSSDTLTATYVADEHRRVTMERFIGTPSSPDLAYASIAVIGRITDRNGMSSLLENVTDSAIRSLQKPLSEQAPTRKSSPDSSASPSSSPSS